jgi:polysaccharide export outer membrane protein
MSSFFAWLPESGWSRLMCDALWQSTLIAGLGYLAARLLTRQSAARAWLLLLTLTACVLVPLASLAARESGWTVTWPRLSETRSPNLAETRPRDIAERETILAVQPEAAPATPSGTLPGQAASGRDATAAALNVLGIVWLTASALLALRLALSCLATVRLIRRAAACGDPELLAASVSAAKRVGLSARPTLLLSRSVRTPTIFALGAPRLLIPTDDVSQQGDRKIDWTAAFTHELAHAARRDGWARLWVELILIALPLQPLVWFSRRAFQGACEEACDDWAVATGSNPVDFADMLTAWICNSNPKPTLLAIGMSSTKARTLRLLSLRGKPKARLGRAWRWAGLPSLLLLVASLAIAQSPNEKKKEPPSTTAKTISKDADRPANDKSAGSSEKQANSPPYIIEPPDVLVVNPVRLAVKEPTRIAPLDKVRIDVDGTFNKQPISGLFTVDSSGDVVLGPAYGAVRIVGLTRLDAELTVKKELEKLLKEPHVALSIDESRREVGISGKHVVGPDGTINLGIYSSVKVGGLTIAEARAAVEKKLSNSFVEPTVAVDVSQFSSNKPYYLVLGGNGMVQRRETAGNETILDMMSQSGLPTGIKSITIARPASASSKRETLNVHWQDVLHGDDTTNYQILPGDRIFIEFKQTTGGVGGEKVEGSGGGGGGPAFGKP